MMTAIEPDWEDSAVGPSRRPAPGLPGDLDPGELLSASQVATLLGLKGPNRATTVLNYSKRPGYFPEPDTIETTPKGLLRRYWRRSTIAAWNDSRRAGNSKPNMKVTAPVPPLQWQDVGEAETVTSGEAASILGYADTGSFTSAYGQGNLAGLGEPVGTGATPTARSSRLWSKRRVLMEAEARYLRASHLRQRQRLCEENLRSDQPVGAAKLHGAHPELGTREQWTSALKNARRAATTAKDSEVG